LRPPTESPQGFIAIGRRPVNVKGGGGAAAWTSEQPHPAQMLPQGPHIDGSSWPADVASPAQDVAGYFYGLVRPGVGGSWSLKVAEVMGKGWGRPWGCRQAHGVTLGRRRAWPGRQGRVAAIIEDLARIDRGPAESRSSRAPDVGSGASALRRRGHANCAVRRQRRDRAATGALAAGLGVFRRRVTLREVDGSCWKPDDTRDLSTRRPGRDRRAHYRHETAQRGLRRGGETDRDGQAS